MEYLTPLGASAPPTAPSLCQNRPYSPNENNPHRYEYLVIHSEYVSAYRRSGVMRPNRWKPQGSGSQIRVTHTDHRDGPSPLRFSVPRPRRSMGSRSPFRAK